MAEKVEKLAVHREKDFMYYVKEASVWRVHRKQPGVPKGRPEKVATGDFEMDTDFIYFVDRDGDVSRAKRAVGGQKRKTTGLIAARGKPSAVKARGAARVKPAKAAGKTTAKGSGKAKGNGKGKGKEVKRAAPASRAKKSSKPSAAGKAKAAGKKSRR